MECVFVPNVPCMFNTAYLCSKDISQLVLVKYQSAFNFDCSQSNIGEVTDMNIILVLMMF